MSDGTTVGKIQLGVELPELDKQITDALKGVEGKINQALGKTPGADEIGQALTKAFDTGVQAAETASRKMAETMDGVADSVAQKLEAAFKRLENLKIQPIEPKVNPADVKMAGAMAMPKLAMPRAPPLKVDLDQATQLKHMDQMLSVLDQRWEALDGVARRHSETVERLQAEYQNLVNDAVTVGGKKFINEESLQKARGDISAAQMKAAKAVEAVVALEQQADRVRAKMQQLSGAAEQPAAEVQSRLGGAFDAVRTRAAGALAYIRQGFGSIGTQFSRLGGPLNRLTGQFNQVGNAAQSAGRRGSFSMQAIGRSITMVLRRLLVLNTAYRILRGFISYVSAAAQTSEGFAASLNSIKLNLAAAFQPILNVILPILNTLAAALAKVTAHIAAFVAALFGTTYKASVQGAREMKTAIDGLDGGGLGDVGKKAGGAGKGLKDAAGAAEKLKGALAGFDELNVLNFPEDPAGAGDGGGSGGSGGGAGGGGGGGGWEAAAMTELGDTSMWDKLAERLKNLFEPFKKAWENEGANTIAALKFALEEVWLLLAAIGRSFEEVWTNGTGQLMLETILRILQNIFYLIGEIARAFRLAWEDDGRGTQIIQNIFDGFNDLLYITEQLTGALRNVWKLGGQEFADNFVLAVLAATGLWSFFTGELRRLWDSNGGPVFERIVQLVMEIGTTILFMYHTMVAPALAMILGAFGFAFDGILFAVQPVLDLLIDFFQWLRGDGQSALAVFAGALVGFGLVWLAINAPIVLIVLAIGAVINVIKMLVDNWGAAKAWLEWAFGDFGSFVAGILEGIGGIFKWIGDQIAKLFPGKVNEGTSKATQSIDNMGGGTRGTLDTMEKDVRGSAAEMAKQLGFHIDAGKRNWENGMGGIESATDAGLSGASSAVDSNMAEMLKSVGYNSTEIEGIMAEMSSGISTDVPLRFSGMNTDATRHFGDMTQFVDTESRDMQRNTTAEMEMLGRKTQHSMKGINTNTQREFTELHAAVKSKLADVARLASSTASTIRSVFGGLNLYGIGQNIMNSLISGMTSRRSALYSSLSNMVSQSISSVKKGYGIASPSKIFTFFGKMLPEGLIQGIDAMLPQLGQKMDEIVQVPDLVEPELANVGRSENAVQQKDSVEMRGLLERLLQALESKDDDSGDMHVLLTLPDGTELTRMVIREWKKMQKQGGVPALG